MMNLLKKSEEKAVWKSNGLRRFTGGLATIFLVPTLLMSCGMSTPVYAETEAGKPAISIEKPSGWKQGSTTVAISVDASAAGEGFSIAKIEARTGNDSGWQDVTAGKTITITGNQTVYVRVTDTEGNVYEQNRSIKCYDDEKPTLSASLSDGVLTIKGNDSVSGIASFTVNGATYTELENGQLKIQLTQKDFTTKKIEITATDTAGNVSDVYSMQNPYYEWAVQQAQAQAQAQSGNGLSTTTDPTSNEPTTAPLPQEAQASDPTEARGTVDERTITGIEEELAQSGESAETIRHTATQGTKEFYAISTKSGKTFYLIVDNSQTENNVYFLTEVSERDLMNFTLSDTVTLPDVGTVYAQAETEPTPEPTPETEKQEETEEVKMPEEKNPIGSYLLIGLIALGGVGAGYYFKVYKPKNEFDDEEDEYEGDEDAPEEKREYEEDDAPENTGETESEPEEVLEDEDEE